MIYLCSLQQLVGDVDDDRATDQMALLGSILEKLGFRLMSGVAPNVDELWAAPIEDHAVPRGADLPADAFERRFLAWLHISFGVLPSPQQGTNASAWTFRYGHSHVEFVIVGQKKNTATAPAAATDWLLRIEEDQPTEFINFVEHHFTPGSVVRRRMGEGRIRAQFKSGHLMQEFIDQTDGTM